MTRAKVEKKVAEKLWEIYGILEEFDPEIRLASICVHLRRKCVSAYSLKEDELGEVIPNEYYFEIFEEKEG